MQLPQDSPVMDIWSILSASGQNLLAANFAKLSLKGLLLDSKTCLTTTANLSAFLDLEVVRKRMAACAPSRLHSE